MSEQIEVDEYERSRSRSPVRERSPRRDSDRRPDYRDRDRGGSFRGDRRRDDRGPRGMGRGGRFGDRDRGDRRDRRDRYDDSRYSTSSYSDKTNRDYTKSVFVGNLPFECGWSQLKDHFKQIGEVAHADIVTSRGRSRGMGTVEFADASSVQKAIDQLHHTNFMDREIFVREDKPPPEKKSRDREFRPREDRDGEFRRDERRGGDRDRDFRRDDHRDDRERRVRRETRQPPDDSIEVFVGNLPFRTRTEDLEDYFNKAGAVVFADVREDDRGRSRGYGIVAFNTREEADRAIDMYKDLEIDGRKIDVRDGKNNYKRPADEEVSEFNNVTGNGEKSNTIFVGNLPYSTINEDLNDLFLAVGEIAKAEIQRDGNRSRGTGVVQFVNESDAEVAINELNGYVYGDRKLNISYATF